MTATASSDSAPHAPSARERILDTADVLFAAHGITQVGIDRIIAEAGVTKATFYKQYGSKDTLILEYIAGRDERAREAVLAAIDAAPSASDALVSLARGVVAEIAAHGFRGDPLVNAAVEYPDPGHAVRLAVAEFRDWLTETVEGLLRESGVPRPGVIADELMLLRDGALAGAYAGDAIAASSAYQRVIARVLGRSIEPDEDFDDE